jgi:hypothetical protein
LWNDILLSIIPGKTKISTSEHTDIRTITGIGENAKFGDYAARVIVFTGIKTFAFLGLLAYTYQYEELVLLPVVE